MPFLFIVIGLVMILSAVHGTDTQLVALLVEDFTGSPNFLYWVVVILIVGAVGYVPDLRPISRIFLVLVIVTMIIKSGGGVQQFISAIQNAQPSSTNAQKLAAKGQVSD